MIEGEWAGRITGVNSQVVEIAMMITPMDIVRLSFQISQPPTVSDHRTAPINSLAICAQCLLLKMLMRMVMRLMNKHGATLVGEVVNYENIYRLCYMHLSRRTLIGLRNNLVSNYRFTGYSVFVAKLIESQN